MLGDTKKMNSANTHNKISIIRWTLGEVLIPVHGYRRGYP